MVVDIDSYIKRHQKVCYTWGYGGKTTRDLTDTVNFIKNEHKRPVLIIDVRYYPKCKWNENFSGENLAEKFGNNRCHYLHAIGLGNPTRSNLYEYFFNKCVNFDFSYILNFNVLMLLCAEKKPERCHRRFIARYLKTRYFFEIKNL